MHIWPGKMMIGLVLFLLRGFAKELKQGRVRVWEQCFISEGEVDVNKMRQP